MSSFTIDTIEKTKSLRLHLSHNQYQHVYKKFTKKGLIQRFKTEVAKDEPLCWRKIKQLPISQENMKKQNDIMDGLFMELSGEICANGDANH